MEKAYAKLHGCYEALNGGTMDTAMVDLTGGVSVRYDLTTPEMTNSIASGQLFKDMKKWYQQGFLIGYAQHHEDKEEGADQQGIQFNHAYGMLRIEDLPQGPGWASSL